MKTLLYLSLILAGCSQTPEVSYSTPATTTETPRSVTPRPSPVDEWVAGWTTYQYDIGSGKLNWSRETGLLMGRWAGPRPQAPADLRNLTRNRPAVLDVADLGNDADGHHWPYPGMDIRAGSQG